MKNILFLIFTCIPFSSILAQQPADSSAQPIPSAPASAPPPAPAPTTAKEGSAEEESNISFGFKLTPTYNWFTIDREGVDTDGGYIGYTYGIMMDFKIARNYFFATGLEYSARGGMLTSDSVLYSGLIVKADITQRLAFIDIPLALKLKTNEIGYSRYYASFGLMPGFTIKANQDVDFKPEFAEDREKRQNSSDFGVFTLGLNIGLGWEYRFSGQTTLNVGLGYHNGFIDLWSDDNAKLTSNFLSLNLGMYF